MAVADKGKVAALPSHPKGESLWLDSWRRLRRNRAAIAGAIVIVLFILLAVFAPVIAPRSFERQTLEDTNSIPQWVVPLFPAMKVRDEPFKIKAGWQVQVQTGQRVEAGQTLMTAPDGSETVVANMYGVVFVDEKNVTISQAPVEFYPLAAGSKVEVQDGAAVEAGVPLISGDNAVTAAFKGIVYVQDNQVILRGNIGGYVSIRNNYPLGADVLGRDMLSRIIYGTQVSLMVAFIGPLVSIIVGLIVGLAAGYFGGWVDNALMRLVDIMYAFPTLLLIILLMAFFRLGFAEPEKDSFGFFMSQIDKSMGGMFFIFIGIGLTSWMQMARLVRGQVLSVRRREYVEAAHALGAGTPRIVFNHILPNILGPLIVAETLTIPAYISYEAFLSFIGLGVNPPQPSWGGMISEGARGITSYPYQAVFPAIALFLIMFAFNFLGDGLRDALDPRMRGVE